MKKIVLALFLIILNSFQAFSNPDDNNKIKLLLLDGKYSHVIKILEQKQSEGLQLSAEDNYNLGISYQRLFNYNRALKALVEANRIESPRPEYKMALADCFAKTGRSYVALGIYKDVVNLDSGNVGAMIEIGKLLLENGKTSEAESVYNLLIEQDSTNDYFYRQLAYCQYKLNNKEAALNSYNKALDIDSLNTATLLQLSKLYFKDEEYEKAFFLIRRGISVNSSNMPLNRLGAEVLFKMQKYRSAAVQYSVLLDAGDTTAAVYQKMGFCNYFVAEQFIVSDSVESRERLNKAIIALEKSRSIDTEDPLTSLYLGICFKELKDYPKSISYFEETLNLIYPDYLSSVYVHLGAALEMEKNYTKSIEAYKQALNYDPSNNSIIFQLAAVYDQYYADREVPLIYYRLFIKKDGDENPILKNYAESRISSLMEELHFSGGKSR